MADDTYGGRNDTIRVHVFADTPVEQRKVSELFSLINGICDQPYFADVVKLVNTDTTETTDTGS